MQGKLIGIGIGPGDPELLTLRAIRAIRECAVIAVPSAGNGGSTALAVAGEYVGGKEVLECRFVMERDPVRRREARQLAAESIAARLAAGQDVGFLTLGDPAIYSTYIYVHEIIVGMGFSAEIVPGVSSCSAAAAALGTALCAEDEPLLILPGGCEERNGELLDVPGSKVIMKSGERLSRVLGELKSRGCCAKIASRVSMPDERLYPSIEAYEAAPAGGYFTVAIVREKPHG